MVRKSSAVRSPKKYQPKEITWYNQKYSIEDIAKKAIQTAKTVANLINTEPHDAYSNFTTSVTSTALIEQIGGNIPLGITSGQRIGNSVKLNYIEENHLFNMSGSDTNVVLRLMYVKCEGSSAPTITDILIASSVTDFPNKDTSVKINVIYDKSFHLNSTGKSGLLVNFSKSFKNYHLEWNEDSTTVKRTLYRVLLTDSVNSMGRRTSNHLIYYDN